MGFEMQCGWLLFLAASFILGFSVLLRLSILRRLCVEECVIFSLITGITFAVWIAYIIALSRRSVDGFTILLTAVLCIFIAFLLISPSFPSLFSFPPLLSALRARKKQNPEGLRRHSDMILRRHSDKISAICVFLIAIYASTMNLYCVLRPENGNLYAMHSVWGDYPFHTSIITSFVYGNNFPPVYPQFLEEPMRYPLLMDFLSAVLMVGGLDLRNSILLPNIILHTALFSSFFFLARRISQSHIVASISTLLLIFSGYPPGLDKIKIHFLNPIYAVFLPQRTAILGFGISFFIYLLLFHAFLHQYSPKYSQNSDEADQKGDIGEGNAENRRLELLLAGTLAGALPFIHAHSFIAVSFVCVFLAFVHLISSCRHASGGLSGICVSEKRALVDLIFLFAPLIAFSLPQVLAIKSQVSGGFFSFQPGWTDENMRIISHLDWSNPLSALISSGVAVILMASFWCLNLNVLSFVIPIGLIYARKDLKMFYAPFLLIFFIANIVKFQPWYWDNYKIFLHWYAISLVLAASAMILIYERCSRGACSEQREWQSDGRRSNGKRGDGCQGERSEGKRSTCRRAVCAIFVCFMLSVCTIFGIATHVGMFEKQAVLWSQADFAVASWIRENTPPNATFLTAGGGIAHNHPVPSLAGRRIPLGYSGWLWSHGFSWSEIQRTERDLIEMFKGNASLLSKYHIDYICVGPFEENFARIHNFKINTSGYELKYDEILPSEHGFEHWRIYKVR